ncbi:MAG: hypothetical protein K6F69_02190 [Treponema sp.]|nr:hypothetical protein [Treponema sp.]
MVKKILVIFGLIITASIYAETKGFGYIIDGEAATFLYDNVNDKKQFSFEYIDTEVRKIIEDYLKKNTGKESKLEPVMFKEYDRDYPELKNMVESHGFIYLISPANGAIVFFHNENIDDISMLIYHIK